MFVGAIILVPTILWLASSSRYGAAILIFKLIVISIAAFVYVAWKKRDRIATAAKDGSIATTAYVVKGKRIAGSKLDQIKKDIQSRADKI